SQAFVVLLPVKSVGVMGDERTYEYTAVVRSANTIDFMTATWSKLPYEFLELVSSRIINEVRGINRVAYDISSKPPATIEWEQEKNQKNICANKNFIYICTRNSRQTYGVTVAHRFLVPFVGVRIPVRLPT